MKNFAYITANTEKGAVDSLNEKSLALAGGTDILNLMKDYVIEPEALVNLKTIPGLAAIEDHEGGLRIGANALITDILDSDKVRSGYPALHQSLYEIATPQIRNQSTLGGNLCARPRCWYFRYEIFDCRKRGGETCPAVAGDNEFHAIFGTDGPCVIIHPSSAAPALAVYGAKVRIASPGGPREVGIDGFFTMPSAGVTRENVLAPNEFVSHVILPPNSSRSAFYEVRHKDSHDWPLAMAAVALDLDGASVRDARICLGAVAPVPWRVPAAEAVLKGGPVNESTAAAAAAKAVEGAKPLPQNRYKIQLTRTAVQRALLAAAGRRV